MSAQIDNPEKNDNRAYQYDTEFYERHEFPTISSFIPSGAKIIDLGCGNGALLDYLTKNNKVNGLGLEISPSGVASCLKHNLRASVASIDDRESYKAFQDNEFDFAICNVTLQMVQYPEVLFGEMKRISKYQIISIPNFAYLENRLDLMFNGVMPRKMLFGYSWYNTGHIHQLSLKDFKKLCAQQRVKILKRQDFGCFSFISHWFWPNLLAKESLFLCEKL